jgi:hypothetical protein
MFQCYTPNLKKYKIKNQEKEKEEVRKVKNRKKDKKEEKVLKKEWTTRQVNKLKFVNKYE